MVTKKFFNDVSLKPIEDAIFKIQDKIEHIQVP